MVDSIERMRRINDLTRELKQHGFAESSFEAIQQANQIFGDDDLDENVKNGLIKNSAHDKMDIENQTGKDETMGDDSVNYNDRKLAKVADSVQVLTEKMNEIIRAINDLDARITDVKAKQDRLAIARQEPRVEPRVEVKVETSVDEGHASRTEIRSEPKSEQKSESHEKPTDEYSMNQRTGNFQSQDVAIDKMFYFGNKK
jgi:hypothetical protein